MARPSLDQTGYFEMPQPPGFAGELSEHIDKKAGRPPVAGKDDKVAEAWRMKAEGMSLRDIAAKLGVSKTTVSRWLEEDEEVQ